jgi:hypothetical protein
MELQGDENAEEEEEEEDSNVSLPSTLRDK